MAQISPFDAGSAGREAIRRPRVQNNEGKPSRIERGRQPYSEPLLKALGGELTGGDPASLLMRNPSDPEGIWSIWDKARPAERKLIVELAKTLIKTGT